jgi:predicted MPP superfamily phosphohydrolase
MSKRPLMARFALFIALVMGLLAGIHYYLWVRLVRAPRLPAPWNGTLSFFLVLLALSLPAMLLVGRRYPQLGRVLAWPAFIWMGVMFLLFVMFLSADLVRLFATVARRIATHDAIDLERRTFISRLTATLVAVFAIATGTAAVRSALAEVRVRRLRVRLDRLPRVHNGLSIVQLTDIHVGPTIGRAFIEDIVHRTNALEPDLVAITGDLVDGSVSELREAVAPLGNLRARHGVFFVTGNHEYFSGAEEWVRELARIGIRVLRNERVLIGDGADAFDLAGIDDRSALRHGGMSPVDAVTRALAGRDPTRELVLLAHQPRSFFDATSFDVGLQLSGHTHAGQVWPFNYLVRLQQPFLAGLHQRGRSQIYVSSGTGYWGPPMRLGTAAEITHLTLVGPHAIG